MQPHPAFNTGAGVPTEQVLLPTASSSEKHSCTQLTQNPYWPLTIPPFSEWNGGRVSVLQGIRVASVYMEENQNTVYPFYTSQDMIHPCYTSELQKPHC